MSKEDIIQVILGIGMEKLELEPSNINKNVKEEKPVILQQQPHKLKSVFTKNFVLDHRCSCHALKKCKKLSISKKKSNKLLKEPVLKLLQSHGQISKVRDDCILRQSRKCSCSSNANSENLNLCALVDNCNQLKISSEFSKQKSLANSSNKAQWWRSSITNANQNKEAVSGNTNVGSCSQQALNPTCDVTIDELASYFETLVHIPKKMSSMAEMMYI